MQQISCDNLFQRILSLPPDMEREIYSFIIPMVTFSKCKSKSCPKQYQVAHIDDKFLEISIPSYTIYCTVVFLSRIQKKNGKYRYYITKKLSYYSCNGCGELYCMSDRCDGRIVPYYSYDSTYAGNNISYALLQLFAEK